MQIGILTNTFDTTTPEDTARAVAAHELQAVQLELASVGLPAMPDADEISRAEAQRIRDAFAERGVAIAAVSGTFNMAHPDSAARQAGLRRLDAVAAACGDLGARVITLCTGTRSRESMWRWHADSYTDAAWRDMSETMRAAAHIGEAHGVTMAFEPEVNNVVDSAQRARRLLDEVASPRLKVIMDGANIFHTGELPRMTEMLHEAFDLLGKDIALAHAKDLDHDGDAGHLPAGKGLLDYPLYLSLLRQSGFDGAIILHGLRADEVDGCAAFLRGHLSTQGHRPAGTSRL
jgi:sugar phosphate isomerase/epimerase